MPALSGGALTAALIDAIELAGGAAVSGNYGRTNPKRLHVQTPSETQEWWVYIWTLTHGGRKTLPDEYRIQMTSVSSPLALNPNGKTLLLGYEPSLGMFAGFDLGRHRRFTTGSPSVQVDIKTLHKALADGLAFDRKTNDEIAIGFRPDQILNYAKNAEQIFGIATDNRTLRHLETAAAAGDVAEEILSKLPPDRRRIIVTLSKLSRDARFKKTVLTAYDNRCAVTRAQLKLVEAAHILPVATKGSLDIVTNGLALSPTMHRAYDLGLIFLDTNYRMHVSSAHATQLTKLNLHSGLSDFKLTVERPIHLPSDRRQWPHISFIRKAISLRSLK